MARTTDPLDSIPLFAAVPKAARKHLAPLFREERFAPNQEIVTEGQPGGRMYIIVEGNAAVIWGGRTRKKIGAGALIGEMSVFDRSPRSATIKTETPVVALSMSSTEFLGALEEQPTIARAVMRTMAERLRGLEKDLAQH
jgi:CRP-like cAMP-binding protein